MKVRLIRRCSATCLIEDRTLYVKSLLYCAIFMLVLEVPTSSDPPPGYYDPAAGLTGLELQTALHDIIDDHTNISYNDIWIAFFTTDDKPGNIVWDMYSDIPGGTPP